MVLCFAICRQRKDDQAAVSFRTATAKVSIFLVCMSLIDPFKSLKLDHGTCLGDGVNRRIWCEHSFL